MVNLAIIGHATRGKEVIELLEMLGGINKENYRGNASSDYYYINDNYIDWKKRKYFEDNFIFYTLEEFYEKYPYKVGDKVLVKGYESPVNIFEMIWNGSEIEYRINIEDDWLTADELQPYKKENSFGEYVEEKMKESEMLLGWVSESKGKRLIPHKDYEIKKEGDEFYLVKKKRKYPKTYEECCSILNFPHSVLTIDVPFHYSQTLIYLTKLLLCRDAYWKIAGEQMGLGKPWKPEWKDNSYKHSIMTYADELEKDAQINGNTILVFPTEEMRNTFYDNFKELIVQCKELL